MRRSSGVNHKSLRCVACGYSLHGHEVGVAVTCPECGGLWTYRELLAAATATPRFRWWMTPLFFAPAAVLVAMRETIAIATHGIAPAIAVFLVLFAMAWAALGDQRPVERVGSAFVLAEFLWFTNVLLAGLLPGLI